VRGKVETITTTTTKIEEIITELENINPPKHETIFRFSNAPGNRKGSQTKMSASKSMKLEKPANPYTRRNPIRSRATDAEWKAIEANARKYCKGNVSEWIRLAAVRYAPSLQSSGEGVKILSPRGAAGSKSKDG
jgi:hypothetical protein